MPISTIAPVWQEPEESIVRWSVREVLCGDSSERTRHLVGYIARRGSGRVTSPIQSFDRDKMTIITRSGRVYRLEGQPGFNADAEYVWAHWKVLNDVQEEVDVTDHYQRQLH